MNSFLVLDVAISQAPPAAPTPCACGSGVPGVPGIPGGLPGGLPGFPNLPTPGSMQGMQGMQGLPGLQGPGLDLGQLGLRPGPLGPSFSGVTPSTLATIYYSCKMLQVKHCQTWQKHKSDKLARQTFQILSAHVLLRGWTRSDAVQLPGPSDAAGRCFTTSNSRLLILGLFDSHFRATTEPSWHK